LVDEKTPESAATDPDSIPSSGSAGEGSQDSQRSEPAEREAASPPEPVEPTPAAAAPSPEAPEAAQAPSAEADRPSVVVRYGTMGLLGRFVCPPQPWSRDRRVVVKSDRGQEIGTIVCPWHRECAEHGVPDQVKGEVLREVVHGDEVEQRHLHESEKREFAFCQERIAARGLPMKLVEVEHLFGGDRIFFYFLADSRVDFRALVRDLAQEFQTRIEMRQIGVRDEARLLGDYERCGQPLCCRAWIKNLAPVSMKMAKIQRATLDPTKISGRCGRLMCCLRFEHETYRELARNLPRKNSYVATPDGVGQVVDADVLTQMVGVQLVSGSRINVPVESILERDVDPRTLERSAAKGETQPVAAVEPPKAEAGGEEVGVGETGAANRRRGRRRSKRRGRRIHRADEGTQQAEPSGSAESDPH